MTNQDYLSHRKSKRTCISSSCAGCVVFLGGFIVLAFFTSWIYLMAPVQTNLVIMGIDYTKPGSYLGRSDTLILVAIDPNQPTVKLLSVPRDLWVNIPGVGENRINTAHFYAEAQQPGSGPQAVVSTIRDNFQISLPYFARIRFENFKNIVEKMGGLEITLDKPTAGYSIGTHHLTGKKALAFARNRAGSDDFFRMGRGQILLKAGLKQMQKPTNWLRIPSVLLAMKSSIDTNIPVWVWPRLGYALWRTGADGIDSRSISREMVTPFTTEGGANVLLPDWPAIQSVINEMYN